MHFGFILKTKDHSGATFHWACQMHGATRKECEKRLLEQFQQNNVYASPVSSGEKHTLEVILECHECEDGYENSIELFEKVSKKSEKLGRKGEGQ